MTIEGALREQVRQRAGLACEFCGVNETDVGGPLTIDHFQPRVRGGSNEFDNLLYCCANCNSYKLDYWPTVTNSPSLWNPRREAASEHFFELDNGTLLALTRTGAFTIHRLRLNRPALVAQRLRKRKEAEKSRLLAMYVESTQFIGALLVQQAALMEDQQRLLDEQRKLLRLLLRNE